MDDTTLPDVVLLDARVSAIETLVTVLLGRTAIGNPSFREGLNRTLEMLATDNGDDIKSAFRAEMKKALEGMVRAALQELPDASSEAGTQPAAVPHG